MRECAENIQSCYAALCPAALLAMSNKDPDPARYALGLLGVPSRELVPAPHSRHHCVLGWCLSTSLMGDQLLTAADCVPSRSPRFLGLLWRPSLPPAPPELSVMTEWVCTGSENAYVMASGAGRMVPASAEVCQAITPA